METKFWLSFTCYYNEASVLIDPDLCPSVGLLLNIVEISRFNYEMTLHKLFIYLPLY